MNLLPYIPSIPLKGPCRGGILLAAYRIAVYSPAASDQYAQTLIVVVLILVKFLSFGVITS